MLYGVDTTYPDERNIAKLTGLGQTSMMYKAWFRSSQMKLAVVPKSFTLFFCCSRIAITYLKRQLYLKNLNYCLKSFKYFSKNIYW